jgi:hypothetical protein
MDAEKSLLLYSRGKVLETWNLYMTMDKGINAFEIHIRGKSKKTC